MCRHVFNSTGICAQRHSAPKQAESASAEALDLVERRGELTFN
jgi:hypothetical protein